MLTMSSNSDEITKEQGGEHN